MDITSELFRLQPQARRRAMAWDAAFELVRASVGAPDSDRYRLVTQRVIEEIVRHLTETEEEIPRLTAALADPTAVLITTTLVATCLAEQLARQTGVLVDEAISRAVTRVATEGKRSVS